jgi:hypothetical protein
MYELKEIPIGNMAEGSYITRDEFENAIKDLKKEVAAGRII